MKVWKILALIFIFLTSCVALLFYFKDISLIFVFGIVLIIISEKLRISISNWMDKISFPSKLRKITILLIFLSIIIIFGVLINSQILDMAELVKNEQDNINASEGLFEEFQSYIPEVLDEKVISEDDFSKLGSGMFSIISDFLQKLSFFIFSGVIIIPLMFNMYYKKRSYYKKLFVNNIPKKFSKGFSRALKDTSEKLNDFLTAKILESIIVGAIGCIGFYIAGVKGWFFLGVLTGIFNVAPYIGPFVGAIPPIITGYLDSPRTAVFALITVLVAQGVDNFYLQPFMIPGKVKLDPLLSISLLLISAKLFGITGMIFALPIFIIYRIILKESYEELVRIYPEKSG